MVDAASNRITFTWILAEACRSVYKPKRRTYIHTCVCVCMCVYIYILYYTENAWSFSSIILRSEKFVHRWYFGHQVLDSESYVFMYKVCLSVVCLTLNLVCRTVHAVLAQGDTSPYCASVSITQGLHNACILDSSFWIVISRSTHQF